MKSRNSDSDRSRSPSRSDSESQDNMEQDSDSSYLSEESHSSDEDTGLSLAEQKKILRDKKEAEISEVLEKLIHTRASELSGFIVSLADSLAKIENGKDKSYEFLHTLDLLGLKIENLLLSLDTKKKSYLQEDVVNEFYYKLFTKMFIEDGLYKPTDNSKISSFLASMHTELDAVSYNVDSMNSLINGMKSKAYAELEKGIKSGDVADHIMAHTIKLGKGISYIESTIIPNQRYSKDTSVKTVDLKNIIHYFSERYSPQSRFTLFHNNEKIILREREKAINDERSGPKNT